jgi:biotin synthase-related radical SAM superfamily protein
LARVVESGEPFKTSGCPDCNRPFYNESPGETIYNYPTIDMALTDLWKIKLQLKHILNHVEEL